MFHFEYGSDRNFPSAWTLLALIVPWSFDQTLNLKIARAFPDLTIGFYKLLNLLEWLLPLPVGIAHGIPPSNPFRWWQNKTSIHAFLTENCRLGVRSAYPISVSTHLLTSAKMQVWIGTGTMTKHHSRATESIYLLNEGTRSGISFP